MKRVKLSVFHCDGDLGYVEDTRGLHNCQGRVMGVKITVISQLLVRSRLNI